jgi:UDP-N-acetylglucosamine 2-epimerase (non-hydrolysing)
MPEEHNRVIIDHISEFLFAPTSAAKKYLKEDNVRGKIFVVGNTIVDSTISFSDQVKIDDLRQELSLPDRYALLTLHREENVDSSIILRTTLECVAEIADLHKLCFVFPIHPRTQKMIEHFGYEDFVKSNVFFRAITPLGYMRFLSLTRHASLVMTDSGGVQEEACILKTPCITLRESTERPETVAIGANIVAGTKRAGIMEAFEKWFSLLGTEGSWKNPYGDGFASRRIIETCLYGKPGDEFVDS